jgi:hypothetical protein
MIAFTTAPDPDGPTVPDVLGEAEPSVPPSAGGVDVSGFHPDAGGRPCAPRTTRTPPLHPPPVHPPVSRVPATATATHLDPLSPQALEDDTERLGDEIARLAAHVHAATYRLLVLIRAFDQREGWGCGFRSCAAWLSWRTGIAPGPAREKVRVAEALDSLPRISEAMARGELSYSKVRALTRVATPENEVELLDLARHATAAHLERLVRAWRRVERLEEAEQEEARHRSRYVNLQPDEDGSWVLRGRLDPEVGALLQMALEWAGEALYRQDRAEAVGHQGVSGDSKPDADVQEPRSSAERGEASVTAPQRRADALALLAERAMAAGGVGEEATRDPEEPARSLPLGRADRFQVVVHVDAEALKGASDTGIVVLAQSGGGVPAETSRRLACDAGVVEMRHDTEGEVLDVGRRRRTVPPAIRRALEYRDQGCRFPGCGCRYTDAHHITHWANGGETKLDNLVLLCARHHRAVHEEGFRVELVVGAGNGLGRPANGVGHPGAGLPGGRGAAHPGAGLPGGRGEAHPGAGGAREVRFYRPDGRLIPEVPDPPTLPDHPISALERDHRERGVEPDGWTPTPLWNGERFDYSLALDMLHHPLARRRQAEMGARGTAAARRSIPET